MATSNSSWYQYPNRTQTQDLHQIFGYVNDTVGGIFFPVMMLVVWVVVFAGGMLVPQRTTNSTIARSFTFASFITSILSMMGAVMDYISPKIMYLNFILLAIGVMWAKLSSTTID